MAIHFVTHYIQDYKSYINLTFKLLVYYILKFPLKYAHGGTAGILVRNISTTIDDRTML